MAQYVVQGGIPLTGHVTISGNKNSVLKLMAASLLAKGTTTLTNVPHIADVTVMAQILETLGCKITGGGTSTLTIDTTGLKFHRVDPQLATKVRASIVLLSPLLARFAKVELGFPGGDTIGKRGLGTHFDVLTTLGAKFTNTPLVIKGQLANKPQANIFLDEASVTATENALMFAATLPQTTTIENAACEPHVVDLGQMLTKMGAKIQGLGSNTITITGSEKLKSVTHSVGPDYIDAGTFAIAAAATNGSITISPLKQSDMRMILLYLARFGIKYRWTKSDTLAILPAKLEFAREGHGVKHHFQTRPWPGFPTDLMSPLITLATQTNGTVLLHDWMYETRMYFTDRLILMGANITLCDPHRIIVSGPTPLFARHLPSPDIRAGMSLLIAALCAHGQSEIDHVEIIERGYEDPIGRLNSLGANIKRLELSE